MNDNQYETYRETYYGSLSFTPSPGDKGYKCNPGTESQKTPSSLTGTSAFAPP